MDHIAPAPAGPDTTTTAARQIVSRFIDAFNDRDVPALEELVAPDAELRTLSGDGLRGHAGLQTLVETARKHELRLVPFRNPDVERDGSRVRVSVPLRELIGPDDIERVAEFELRDGRIVAFAVLPFG